VQITVKGKNLDVTDELRELAVAKLSRVRRLYDRFIDMEVTFSEEANPRIEDRVRCEVVLHAKGRYLRAEAAGPDASTAIDRAEDKLSRQVRKLKTQMVSRPRNKAATPMSGDRELAGVGEDDSRR